MLREGQRVFLQPENREAEVYRFHEREGRYVVGLIWADTRQAQEYLFTPEELAERLTVLPTLVERFSQSGACPSRDKCLAFVEALRMRLAYTFDPHYAVSVTQVDLLPHQVEAVYRYILPQPRVRFLLADDPGLGKTIMAGLVLKELKARGLAGRVLIVVPAHLLDQWQREMQERFREDFTILNRELFRNLSAADFFERNPQVLVSLDFARQEEVRNRLSQLFWDLVIVDEAHKLSATRYGNKIYKTKRYQLGEALSNHCTHLLFLTATPHKGNDDAYFLLLDLLHPRLFAKVEHLKEAVRREGLPFVLRRSKEQVTDLAGNKLFQKREVRTLAVNLTEAERQLYDAVTAYVRRWYGAVSKRTDRRSRNVALALTLLQRRLSSSLFAVRESLRRRRNKLHRLREEWERRLEEEEALPVLDEDTLEDLSEQTAREWESFQERLEGITAATNPEELAEEIRELEALIHLAQEAERAGEEAKVRELRRVVEKHLRHHPEEKLLIFTEFKDTLLALQRKIEQEWGFPVVLIHGDMSLSERIEAERRFRHEVQILIGTDAAGEGLNLQFARLMVNFDLPWNPNRLEQRMGRIHRYGQKRECYVFNMLYRDTREGVVLERLLEKLERMRERLGDSVYDVIGELMEGVRLEELIMEAILREDAGKVEQLIEVDLEGRLEEYRRALEESALAQHHINLSGVLAGDRESRQKCLVPWDVERFTRHVVPLIGGTCEPDARRPGVFRLTLPRSFLHQHPLPKGSFLQGARIAFERRIAQEAGADFFAPGHPVLEALVDECLRESRPVLGLFTHPDGEEGIFWLFRASVEDGQGRLALERLIALFWNTAQHTWQEVDPRMVWDLEAWPRAVPPPAHLLQKLEAGEEAAKQTVMAALERLREETAQRRARESRIKKEWLERSYNHLLRESNEKLFDYDRRAEKGEDMRAAIQQEEENLKRLMREKEERLAALAREGTLTLREPQLEAVFLVCAKPLPEEIPDEQARRRIEQIGMELALRYEQEQGRKPIDVSREYLGYDIRSEGGGEVRYIEVKAFATTGPVELTPHEWQMAQRLQDAYWLYVVENAASAEPVLHPMQNPAAYLRAEPITGIVKVIIKDWHQR
ncbi:MAG: helicase [Bacteroidia bacterium]|nr:MAG: helicase [Bacteroidia bacterium]